MRSRVAAATLPFDDPVDVAAERPDGTLEELLTAFDETGSRTVVGELAVPAGDRASATVLTFTNEFWTARQRMAHSLHEVSYRACFKPQLPRFFIERLTHPGDIVYDPFMGRGTTLLEAALLGRHAWGCDVNPLSRVLCEPRLGPPALADVARTLKGVDWNAAGDLPEDLLVFYHPDTLREICALRTHLLRKAEHGTLTDADRWVRMVAVNRLTGHSAGFFSVYTLPPNQAVSVRSQAKINARRNQTPPRRDVPGIVLRKSRALLQDVTPDLRDRLAALAAAHRFLTGPSSDTLSLPAASVALAVTSPPFLDVVDYQTDNWLRCWFAGIDAAAVPITMARQLETWRAFVTRTLEQVRRVLKPGGHIAFEVGEVRGGSVRLEETVIPAGVDAGLEPVLVLINAQAFTKTANCWGVSNNCKGTNTNRVVLMRNAVARAPLIAKHARSSGPEPARTPAADACGTAPGSPGHTRRAP
jgi:DNA modification methylase